MQTLKPVLFTTIALILAALTVTPFAAADTFKVLHPFTWAKTPSGNLVLDAAGNLYGTTEYGGSTRCGGGCGVVFKLAHNPTGTWSVGILHVFGGDDGANPTAGLIFDTAGNLYGTAPNGGAYGNGVVFKLKPNSDGTWTESVLQSFSFSGALAELMFDPAGNLYGTNSFGGSHGYGSVFKLKPNADGTWTESDLYSFAGGADGAFPNAGLVFDAAGNLYSTTPNGGVSTTCPGGCGVAFKLAANPEGTWTESVLYSFTGGADGANPDAGLTFDATGSLSGTTSAGGILAPVCVETDSQGCGVVFNLSPNADGTWTESVLHAFTGSTDGARPASGLVVDTAGNLYGTTLAGGVATSNCGAGCGVVFKLSHSSSSWSETVLHGFVGYGSFPMAMVILDHAGDLYGTASSGSTNNGLVFEIMP